MALNRLTSEEMIRLTAHWARARHPVRMALESVAELTMLIPRIDRIQKQLIAATQTTRVDRAVQLEHSRRAFKHKFDALARAIYAVLTGHTQLARARDDEPRVEELASLQDLLFPHQLRITTFSDDEIVLQAKLLSARLTPSARALLVAIPMSSSTMLTVIHHWIAAALGLGQLSRYQRQRLGVDDADAIPRSRAAWMRMVHVVRAVVRIIHITDPHLLASLARIHRAEAAADSFVDVTLAEVPAVRTPASTPVPTPVADPMASSSRYLTQASEAVPEFLPETSSAKTVPLSVKAKAQIRAFTARYGHRAAH